jgi:hypothetical protein
MSQNVPSEKDPVLALALATGASINEAAERAGVDRKTVQRKMADPAFRRQVSEFRGELISMTLGSMADNFTRAADGLAALVSDANPWVRLCAIRATINFGLKLRDSVDMAEQVHDLEAELARKQGVAP